MWVSLKIINIWNASEGRMPIFRIVLKHISHYLPLLFQFEWLYLSHEFIHFEDGCSPGQKTQLEDFRPNKKVDIAVFITSTELFFVYKRSTPFFHKGFFIEMF